MLSDQQCLYCTESRTPRAHPIHPPTPQNSTATDNSNTPTDRCPRPTRGSIHLLSATRPDLGRGVGEGRTADILAVVVAGAVVHSQWLWVGRLGGRMEVWVEW